MDRRFFIGCVAIVLSALVATSCTVDDVIGTDLTGVVAEEVTIFVGDTQRLAVDLDGVEALVTWASADTAIATVDERTGVVTGVAPGITTVSAVHAVHGSVVATAGTTVLEPMVLVVSTLDSPGAAVALHLGGAVALRIEWGDGTVAHVDEPGRVSHRYEEDGRYEVRLKGTLEQFGYPHRPPRGLAGVLSWGDLGLESLAGAFTETWGLETVPDSLPETVTDLSWLFSEAENFDHLHDVIAGWSVANVERLAGTFHWTNFNGDISHWDVSRVTTIQALFAEAEFRGDISGWDVSNVVDMSWLFFNMGHDGDLSSWNVANVETMEGTFAGAMDNGSTFNGDITGWDVSNVRSMRRMFAANASFDRDIGAWDVSSVTDMDHMFEGAHAFNRDLSGWCVAAIATEPQDFATDAYSWVEPRPVWGTCPQ